VVNHEYIVCVGMKVCAEKLQNMSQSTISMRIVTRTVYKFEYIPYRKREEFEHHQTRLSQCDNASCSENTSPTLFVNPPELELTLNKLYSWKELSSSPKPNRLSMVYSVDDYSKRIVRSIKT
jgi:hypothetical protein